jgi:Nuclease A inhibitor-like protein
VVLGNGVKGLLYASETEAPLEPFLLDASELSDEQVVKAAGAAKGATVEQPDLDSFFRTVPSADKPKFEKLSKVVREQLSGGKVYRIGDEAEKMLVVAGKSAGVKTRRRPVAAFRRARQIESSDGARFWSRQQARPDEPQQGWPETAYFCPI